MEFIEVTSDEYWKLKVHFAKIISEINGFPEQNDEFWGHQPAGVISLVVKLYEKGLPENYKFKNQYTLKGY
jgi:hypothetical protein